MWARGLAWSYKEAFLYVDDRAPASYSDLRLLEIVGNPRFESGRARHIELFLKRNIQIHYVSY